MVNRIGKSYGISDGEIEFSCDGLSAIDKAFSFVSLLHVDNSNYDLLGAIKNQWAYSPAEWKFCHGAGQQSMGEANVEMDWLAKSHFP